VGLLLAGLTSVTPAPAGANPLKGLQKLFKKWGMFENLRISGTNSLTFQQNLVQGSESAFQGQRWDTDPFIRQSSLSVEGPIWKEFAFKADLAASGYGPSYSRWVVGYIGHDTAVYYGDLNIDLSGNQFASFSKPVQGWQLDQRIGKGLARFFYTEEKAITRYQTFQGNNTSGPFFLTYTPVVQGSEVVKVNEQIMVLGEDYRLEYDTGRLWFEPTGKPPRIIPETATIAISYQSQNYQAGTGTLYGGRVELPLMNNRLRVGMTRLQQDRGAADRRDTVGYQEDIFQGSGSVGPFDVNFRPIIANGAQVIYKGEAQVIQQALVVLVDNAEQAEGVDYDSYRQIGRIIFRRSVPPTALVAIRYYYDLSTSTTLTDQTLSGIDLMYHFSPKLRLQGEWGSSEGGTGNKTGDALRLNLNYTTPRLKVVSEYRDIAPSFTFLDAVGFYRQDRGLDVGVNYDLSRYIGLFVRRSDLKSAQGYSFGYGGSSGDYGFTTYGLNTNQTTTDTLTRDINTVRNDYEVRFSFPRWPTLGIQHQTMSNSGGTSSNGDYDSTNYRLSYSPSGKPYSFNATLNETKQSFLQPSSTGEDATLRSSTTSQLQWSTNYQPTSRLSLSYNQGSNSSSATGTDNRSSSDMSQISARWTISRKMDLNLDQTRTSSLGSISGSSYYYGGGGGIGGGGGGIYIPPGGSTGETDSTNRYTDNSSRVQLAWRPSSKLTFDLAHQNRTYTSGGSVGYLADSDQSTTSLSALMQISQQMALNATWSSDEMTFLDAGRGAVANDMLTLGFNYRKPQSPWGLGVSYSAQSGTSPTYSGYGANQKMRIVANDLSDLRAQLTYSVNPASDIVLTASLSDYAGGYANFNKQQAELGYRRKVGSLGDMTFGYRFIRNISTGQEDPRLGYTNLVSGNQNYITNTFLLTFTTQFASTMGGASRPQQAGLGTYGPASLGNFGGYRVGSGGAGSGNYRYGTGSSFQGLGVFGSTGGSSMQTPFGSGYGSGYGGYGQDPYGSGLGTFGSGFGGAGGFSQGLGDFSGRGQQGSRSGVDAIALPEMPPVGGRPGTLPGAGVPAPPGAETELDLEDWWLLDDLSSLWW
jgi:hypothetical protein